jgi:glycosyltransferase involved in cell wall biosynthesis
MPAVFAQAHIVCLPSAYGEGVPKVLIEAAACGRPIVTTDSPGCREIVQHEGNGLLVPVGEVVALTAALQRLIEAPDLRQRLGAAGRKLAEAEFSLQQVNELTLSLYDRLLTTRQDRPS